jgi:hypothetical protein
LLTAAAEADIHMELVIAATTVQWAQEWEIKTEEALVAVEELVEIISMAQAAAEAEQERLDKTLLTQHLKTDVEDLDIQEDLVMVQEHLVADTE